MKNIFEIYLVYFKGTVLMIVSATGNGSIVMSIVNQAMALNGMQLQSEVNK